MLAIIQSLPIHEGQSSGEPSYFPRSNLGSERSMAEKLQWWCAVSWGREVTPYSSSWYILASGGGPGKSGIRPHLGCGCNDVPGKLGLSDTAWLGTVQPLQGEFCETGVLICFKSDGCSRAPPRGVLCSWCTNLFPVQQGLIGYSPARPRGVLFSWCTNLIWVRWELVTCYRSVNWVGYCCNCSSMSKRNFWCSTTCSWHRG